MIRELNIKNYTIIENAQINFDQGLNIITGETGAGKSILVGALSLILGARADMKTLLNKDKKCIVEGVFDIEKYNLETFFDENDLDYEKELIIRREITPQGKSRAFINDSPTNLTTLRLLSTQLIDLHRQFDTLEIHQENFQMNILDITAGIKAEVQKYRSKFRDFQKLISKLETLKNQNIESAQRIEFVKFQLAELTDAGIKEKELAELEDEQKVLSNASEIKQTLGEVHTTLENFDGGLIERIRDLSRMIDSISSFDKRIEVVNERFLSIVEELADLNNELININDGVENDPEQLQVVEDRLQLLFKLMQKHGTQNSDQLLEIQTAFEEELKSFDNSDAELKSLQNQIETTQEKLIQEAGNISKKRKKIVKTIEEKLKSQLNDLAMPHASMQVEILPTKELTPNGMDKVTFLFSANKGFDMKPLKDVASGGELARINLCLKSLVAGKENLPSLVFDEIDTGISGDVAFKMGQMLTVLAQKHQLICITHSPQVASRGERHYMVEKDFSGDTTTTNIKLLAAEDRIIEIAKMLSGNPPTNAAVENAKELIAS